MKMLILYIEEKEIKRFEVEDEYNKFKIISRKWPELNKVKIIIECSKK